MYLYNERISDCTGVRIYLSTFLQTLYFWVWLFLSLFSYFLSLMALYRATPSTKTPTNTTLIIYIYTFDALTRITKQKVVELQSTNMIRKVVLTNQMVKWHGAHRKNLTDVFRYPPFPGSGNTEKTIFPFPFTLNWIWSWWQFSIRCHHSIWFKIKRKTVIMIISHSMWKKIEILFSQYNKSP